MRTTKIFKSLEVQHVPSLCEILSPALRIKLVTTFLRCTKKAVALGLCAPGQAGIHLKNKTKLYFKKKRGVVVVAERWLSG